MSETDAGRLKHLIRFLFQQKSEKALEETLRMLLTPKELDELPKRLRIIEMLEEGIPQREIADRLNVGIATVTRGSRELQRREKP